MELKQVVDQLKEHYFSNEGEVYFDVLNNIEIEISNPLPADYKYVLKFFSNGRETNHSYPYLNILPAEVALELQSDYEVPDWGPNLLIFAVGGDDAYFFDLNSNKGSCDYNVIKSSLSSRDASEFEIVASSYKEFLETVLKTKVK